MSGSVPYLTLMNKDGGCGKVRAESDLKPKEDNKMNDFMNDFESRYEAPSRAQIDRLIAQAHQMRHEATRDALIGLWGVLRRTISRKAVVPAARHA